MQHTARIVANNKIKILLLAFIVTVIIPPGKSQIKTYNIEDYGAVGDAVTLNTNSIQKAIDECAKNGGGTVYVPSGKFLTGTLILQDNIHLFLESGAVLLGSTEHKDYPRQPLPVYRSQKDPGGWYALIYAEGTSDISITGFGTIDGQGADQKPQPELLRGDRDGRPRNILFISCQNIRVEGITMMNSGIWNQHYLNCEDVMIDNIKVYNHSNRNNDAIDIDGCRRVTISNSIFDSDDDGITLKSTGSAPTEDVTITNCVVSSFCNAIKAGTESTGGFRNININNCVIKPSRYPSKPIYGTSKGITGISLEIVDGGIMEGISISNVTIEGTECPLYIRLGNRGRKHTKDAPEPSVGKMKNISISNLTAYNTGNFSNSITAIPGSYIENVILNNVQIRNTGGLREGDFITSHLEVPEKEKAYPQPTVWGNLPSSVLFVRHVKNFIIGDLIFSSDQEDPRVPIIAVDVKNLSIGTALYSGGSTSSNYALLDGVDNHEIKRPVGWSENIFSEIE
ncbi:MAG: polygalacturonase [Phycisphaeraceae bacterium]|nr:polygalacturonase [Phycisphaeraceae bacterium]